MKPMLRLIRNPIEEELLLVWFPKVVEKPELPCQIVEEERKPDLKLVKN
jgi:hypothetical protein